MNNNEEIKVQVYYNDKTQEYGYVNLDGDLDSYIAVNGMAGWGRIIARPSILDSLIEHLNARKE